MNSKSRLVTFPGCNPVRIARAYTYDENGVEHWAHTTISTPVRYRSLRPIHGHYAPMMLRQTWQERAACWWRRRHPAVKFILKCLGLLAAYVAIALVIGAINGWQA